MRSAPILPCLVSHARISASCSPSSPVRGRPHGSPRSARPGEGSAGGPRGPAGSPGWSVPLRHQLPHVLFAELSEVDRSTVSVSIRQVRTLLAARGFAVPDRPGLRLRTLQGHFAYAEAEDVEPRLDGAETQVRRPQADRPGRRAFVSGKRNQNTVKTTTFSDGQGRLLLSGLVCPGRIHDQTAVRTEGIAEQFRIRPGVKAKVDSAYLGSAKEFPGQVSAPPKKSKRGMRRRQARLARDTAAAVLGEDLCGVHQRRTPPMGTPAPIDRTPRYPRRGPSRDRLTRLRPIRAAGHPLPDEHRTRPRPRHRSVDHPPADPPGQHARSSISPETVSALMPRWLEVVSGAAHHDRASVGVLRREMPADDPVLCGHDARRLPDCGGRRRDAGWCRGRLGEAEGHTACQPETGDLGHGRTRPHPGSAPRPSARAPAARSPAGAGTLPAHRLRV
ncbi:transposase family protein [Streptomyces collinus]|uniref:transposase family protein n=1 Tax=Streptomyces collinus TaxID=42684 RepID=UPI0033FEB8F0